jgi:putative ABC transport system permease protein
MDYISLSTADMVLASSLILVNGGLSIALGLGLERTLFINSVRMLVQLTAIGFVLKFIFAQTTPIWTIGLAMIMIGFAGHEILARQSNRFTGLKAYGLGTGVLLFVGFVCTVFSIGALVQPDPWYAPRYVLPILGMVIGNTMTGIGLGMETLTSSVKREQSVIEARLAMGEPRFTALKGHIRRAMRSGMMPIINAMAASGIISLPGMMTGQIISGVDPLDATKYQLMIMFLIAGGTALGTTGGVLGTALLLTDERHRLRLERLKSSEG